MKGKMSIYIKYQLRQLGLFLTNTLMLIKHICQHLFLVLSFVLQKPKKNFDYYLVSVHYAFVLFIMQQLYEID